MLKLINIEKNYGDLKVLKGVDLNVNRGEVVSILGPSGSGKSTLLRLINHLETGAGGKMIFNGNEYNMSSLSKKEIHEIRQGIGMVFQNFNLFFHLTALENIMEGLITVKKIHRKEARTTAMKYLDEVGLSDKKDSYPSALSGGQQQRVAIARALAMKPDLLLFDEPTSALDPQLVNEVLATIKQTVSQGFTMIIVTHELRFAYEISDKIVFMRDGAVVEEGSPNDFFNKPLHKETQKFIAGSPYSSYVI